MSPTAARTTGRRRLAALTTGTVLAVLLSWTGVALSADIPIATVPVGDSPAAVAVNPLTHTIYAANYYGNTVSVIDGETDSGLATIAMPKGTAIGAVPIAVVVNPLSTPARAYVANWQSHIVSFIDESTLTKTATVTVPVSTGQGNPRALALLATSSPPKLYVANYHSNSVSVLNAETGASMKEIPVGASPRALAMFTSAGRKRLYVANRYSDNVSIIDMDTDSLVATAATGAGPKAMAVNQATGHVFVTSPASDTVTVIDDNDSVIANVAVGDNPLGIDVEEASGRVFVADNVSNDVAVIDSATNTLETTIPVASQPWAVATDQSDRKVYVTNYGAAQVSILDRDLAVTTCAVGVNPYALAIDEGAIPHKTYCANWGSSSLTVIDEPPVVGRTIGLDTAMAEGAPGFSAVAAAVTPLPGNATTIPTPVLTGTASSTRSPYRTDIAAVFVRIDGPDSPLQRAEITAGAGTPDVEWRLATTSPLALGSHSVNVVVFDDASASSVSSGLDQGGRSAQPAGGAGYSFAVRAPYGPTRFEETDTHIAWTGTWSPISGASHSAKTARYGRTGTSVTVLFDGSAIDWIGYRGAFYGIAGVTLDGGAPETVDLYAPGWEYQSRLYSKSGLAAGTHTLRIEWTGEKNVASSNTYIDVDAFDVAGTLLVVPAPPTRFEETDTHIAWTGTWSPISGASHSAKTARYGRTGTSVTVLFDGSAIDWIGYRGAFYGIARVTLDGGAPETVDLYAPGWEYQSRLYSKSGLAAGTHTLRIEWTGEKNVASSNTYIDVDAFDVAGTLLVVPAPPTRFEETDTHIAWTGTWSPISGASHSAKTARYGRTGTSVTVLFDGSAIDWIGYRGAFYGIARVTLDGGAPETVDLYAPGWEYQSRLYSKSGLAAGTHTLRIEWTGEKNVASSNTYIDVDAFDVAGTLLVVP